MIKDKRIKEYKYLTQLKEYLLKAEKKYLSNDKKFFVYPKQLEIHLPSDRQKNCNLACSHCFGTKYKKELGKWETEGLNLLHNLKGAIPYHIYGGAYTEPTMSPFLFSFLSATKKYNNHFGLHTNGTKLKELEKNINFFKNLNEISTDEIDYISISLDAGKGVSWSSLKKKDSSYFWDILYSIEKMANLKAKTNDKSHAIRMVYLASDITSSKEELEFISSFAKNMGINSLRFSVPYDFYNKSFKEVKKYKEEIEDKLSVKIEKYLKNIVSEKEDEKPYIFWNPPYFTDINRFDFEKCYYGFFQITLGADGYIYPCSAVAAPTAKHLRKGKITSNIEEFNKQCWEIQNNKVNPKKDCFLRGLRGNRMALEINEYYNKKDQK